MTVSYLRRCALVGGSIAALSTTAPIGRASPMDKTACIAASEKAQQARHAGGLLAARQLLASCSSQTCPRIVREDCAHWMSEVIDALPTVVLAARDAGGHDLVSVRVTVDGRLAKEQLDGKPTDLDPGVHQIHFEGEGGARTDEKIVVREGEHDRVVTATLNSGAAPPTATAPPATPTPPAAAETTMKFHIPAASWVLAAVGVAAAGTGAAFDASAFGEARCRPDCTPNEVSSIKTRAYVADGLFGGGALSVAVAAIILLAQPRATKASTALRSGEGWLIVRPSSTGAEGALGFRF